MALLVTKHATGHLAYVTGRASGDLPPWQTVLAALPALVDVEGLARWPEGEHAVTCWDTDGPCACFGVRGVSPGLAVAWFAERTSLLDHPDARQIARWVRRVWRAWSPPYRRIECYAPATHHAANVLAQWLGFTQVAVKPLYGPLGETVIEYVTYPQGEPACVPDLK